MQEAKFAPARQLKDRNEFMPTKQKENAGPSLSAVRHQDSETNPKLEFVFCPCAIYHVTKTVMYELPAPLSLEDLALSYLHKQHSQIATSKISH